MTSTIDAAVDTIVARCAPAIVLALPLGLGKPNRLVNALYARVKADPALTLTIYTALSLDPPRPRPGLEARFAGPFLARQFGADYPRLAFVADLKSGALPAHVTVHEFYFQSGALLDCERAQRDYVSLNYTHVARAVAAAGVNVLMQLVARRGERLSLSCNPDTTLDLLDEVARIGAPRPLTIGVVHPELPFLGHEAEIERARFDLVLDEEAPVQPLFALPAEPVAPAEFALGLHAAALVADGGSLQIGIGALSDALVHGLLLRQRENALYRGLLAALRAGARVDSSIGGEAPLARGLYGASEMVMDGFMHLRRAGILARRVFDDLALQRALNDGVLDETCRADALERLIERELVPCELDQPALEWLVRFGFLPEGTTLSNRWLQLPDGARIGANLYDRGHRDALAAAIAGRRLAGGRFLHGGFYLGTKRLYEWLRALDGEEFDGVAMTRISHINELYGGREQLEKAQRTRARFFNTCMMTTLSGAAVSDGLGDGQIVSGVGGQYNFVAMAHALPDGRSILMLRASRDCRGGAQSNIVWNYPHATIARHLRDLVVTEYGVADLRGASDEEIVKRLLAIADARFVDALAARAKAAGKLAKDFVVPDAWRAHCPAALAETMRPHRAHFPTFPFGSDFDAQELALLPALKKLKQATATTPATLRTVLAAVFAGAPRAEHAALLQRMGLDAPRSLGEKLEARLLAWALS
jgi:acyl-CoA hydrolase